MLKIKSYDLDREIEKVTGQSIGDIFREQGETEFRKIEAEVLKQLLNKEEEMLLSCGGGTPCFHNNMEVIKESSISIYLRADVQLLTDRLQQSRHKRPLVEGLDTEELVTFIDKKLSEREIYYSRADLSFDAVNAKSNLVEMVNRLEAYWR